MTRRRKHEAIAFTIGVLALALAGAARAPAWRCPVAWLASGDGCDCGCGMPDPDCVSTAIEACAFCAPCGVDACPGFVDPKDPSSCLEPVCGDGQATILEPCDGADLRGARCADGDFGDGSLACAADCSRLDFSGCGPPAVCGDGAATGLEACDGADLRAATCLGLGLGDGALRCRACALDISACDAARGWQCAHAEFDDGQNCDCGCGATDPDCRDASSSSCDVCDGGCGLGPCPANIDPQDTRTCVIAVCGDGVVTVPERCDGAALSDKACPDLGYAPGLLACSADCLGFDVSACGPANGCGDHEVQGYESCDGDALRGHTCTSLGLGAGALACTTSCAFDLASCEHGGAWTCLATYFASKDGCDCGCGLLDPDCDDAALLTCEVCDEGCGDGACPTNIDPADTTRCLP